MDTFLRFLYEFLSQFFDGFKYIFVGIYKGFVSIEVGKQEKVEDLEKMMKYVKTIYGEK